MEKKLYKVEEGKALCGVCMGLAEYLRLDVNIIRILWVVVSFWGGIGVLLYIVCALILPWKPVQIAESNPVENFSDEEEG